METRLTLFVGLLALQPLAAQDCSIPFTIPLYDVQVEPDILYGSSPSFSGQNVDLRLNLYKPVGDGQVDRPLIVLVHGGGFTGGNRNELNTLCWNLASMGWAAATISYRLGFYAPSFSITPYAYDAAEVVRAAYRSVQDTKGAVRFLKGRSMQDSTSTENVLVLGFSAGAIAGLHTAFVTDPDQKPDECFAIGNVQHLFQQYPRPDLGDIDGELNQNGEDASVIGVVSFFGGLLDTTLVTSPDGPALWMYHQTGDPVVGCDHQQGLWGMPLGVGGNYPLLHGSCSIDGYCGDWAWEEGRYSAIIHEGNSHEPHDATLLYADATLWSRELFCGISTFVAEEPPPLSVRLFPNPTQGLLTVQLPGHTPADFEIRDAMGRMVSAGVLQNDRRPIDMGFLPDGMYLLRVIVDGMEVTERFVVQR